MRIRLGILCLLLTATTASARSLEQQAICAKQAKVAFEEYSADPKSSGPKKLTNDYESHYNPKLNRRLMAIQTTELMGKETYVTALLMDAFQRHVYAAFNWLSHEGKEYGEAPIICQLTPTSQTQTHCSSKDEYDAFVAKYMEE